MSNTKPSGLIQVERPLQWVPTSNVVADRRAGAHPSDRDEDDDLSWVGDLVRSMASTSGPTKVPSKRTNKNKSGRASRKQYNSRQMLRAVGGYDVSTPGAMAACVARSADTKMCVTYEEWKERQS